MFSYQPFEVQLCPVTGKPDQLDPVLGISLDGIASKARRGEIEFQLPWALHPDVGFETRFHGKSVSNVTFRVLPKGFTKGSMLVCFADDELWMRNLGLESGGDGQTPNFWRKFLESTIRDIKFSYSPETEDDSEWFSFSAQALVNGTWISVRPPTIAGCVVDVPDIFQQTVKPCEIPVTFRDFDWLLTSEFLKRLDGISGFCRWGSFFRGFESCLPVAKLVGGAEHLDLKTVREYHRAGHGILGALKGERVQLGLELKIPQLEMR